MFVCVCTQSCCVRLFATPWTGALQAPLSIEFSRQEYWRELGFPTPGIFPTQGSNLSLLCQQVDSLLLSLPVSPEISYKNSRSSIDYAVTQYDFINHKTS